MAELIGLTGKSGAGKTRLFQEIVNAAKSAGLTVYGFFCPAVLEGEKKVGIEVTLLPGGEVFLLGSLEKRKNWQPIGRWWMDPSVFELANEHLKSFSSSDLLFIDEIGPAEIDGNQGWTEALNLLKEDSFRKGVVAFRPAFIGYFKENYPGIKIINLDEDDQSEIRSLMEQFCKPEITD